MRRGGRVGCHASASSPSDNSAEEEGWASRAAAAAAGRLAPLECSTSVGAELDELLKTDPAAFEEALQEQVSPRHNTQPLHTLMVMAC